MIGSLNFSYKSGKLIWRNRRLVAKYFNFSLGWVRLLLFHVGENKRIENSKEENLETGWLEVGGINFDFVQQC